MSQPTEYDCYSFRQQIYFANIFISGVVNKIFNLMNIVVIVF